MIILIALFLLALFDSELLLSDKIFIGVLDSPYRFAVDYCIGRVSYRYHKHFPEVAVS